MNEKEQIKEINQHISDALQQWADIMLLADADNWAYHLEYSDEDVFNAVYIVNHVLMNRGIKGGYICNEEDALTKGEKFKKAIGGVSMHHNYIGGLAEHTLGVMYLSTVFAERYNCRNKEVAILAAKLHDIGKIYEMKYDGPFKYTLEGEMEGHIVIGIRMLDRAFESEPNLYSDEFKARIKGCIVQHHGKQEFGSPKDMNMEESNNE